MKKIRKAVMPSAGPTRSYRLPVPFYSNTVHGAIFGGRAVFEINYKEKANG